MLYKNLVTYFVRGWNHTRSESLEILSTLDDKKLEYKPQGEKFQRLYWEFGCLGRTQLVYTHAVVTGKVDFSLFGKSSPLPKKGDFKKKKEIEAFLRETDRKWVEAIRARRHEENFLVKWPGFNMPLVKHVANLADHERLHQGQLISYFTLAGFELPPNFKKSWGL